MNVNLSKPVIEAIREIQLYGGMHESLAGVEDFILENCTDDESLSSEVLDKVKILRCIRKVLFKICQKEGGEA